MNVTGMDQEGAEGETIVGIAEGAAAEAWVLNSRAVLQCARRVHNDFDPTLSALELSEVSPNRWAEQGVEFEECVVELIHALNPTGVVDLRSAPWWKAING